MLIKSILPTLSNLVQTTVGAGSPVIGTSSRSLFPATTKIVESAVWPRQSKWILGGSEYKEKKS